ncbi:XRE family transcriptional regulator [Patulibacter sp. NPDC049589]|uniref:helix-turn-helix domain-containing protein n=1 Tax=Patulibacter sp. NPDC049589 TaxID=3154731 RepID=UPI0034134261
MSAHHPAEPADDGIASRAASSPEPAADDVQTRVRARLRALRTERGLTLAEAARRAGMDPSSLSRLESGARRLTLDHLPVLARALGVTVDDLLESPAAQDPRVQAVPRTRDGMTFWPLNHHPSGSGHHAFKIRLPSDRREPMPREHEGYDWLYVLSGRLRLVLGEEEFVLSPGEAAEFSTRTPHWIGVVDEPVELLGLFGPEGERVHLRA